MREGESLERLNRLTRVSDVFPTRPISPSIYPGVAYSLLIYVTGKNWFSVTSTDPLSLSFSASNMYIPLSLAKLTLTNYVSFLRHTGTMNSKELLSF
jgi:hypothetical protein